MLIRYPFSAIFAIFLMSCSSTHDLKRDGFNVFGGGFIDETVGPGFFFIKAFSNTSPVATPDSAAKTFRHRAEQLCPKGYSDLKTIIAARQPSTPNVPLMLPKGGVIDVPGHVVTSKIGHILCTDSPLSLDEAISYLNRHNDE